MKIYSGNDTNRKRILIDDLRRTKGANTLYVSHYCFVLDDRKDLIFYYNPIHFWDKCPIEKVADYVWTNLETDCAIFKNVDPDKSPKSKALDNKISYPIFFPETPNYIKSIFNLNYFKKSMTSNSNTIIGAVIGDVIGSVFEWNNIKTTDFNLFNPRCFFTDDTVLTIAVADCILNKKDFARTIWEYGRKYPDRGYGGNFSFWLENKSLKPYDSYGNGSAMRACAAGFAYNDLETVMEVAKQSAEVTHNHPEGIKGAQATATAIFLARQGKSKQEIKDFIVQTFNYNLDYTLEEIRPTYTFDVTCQGTVPQAIVAFLESTDFENAIRLAISIGGDSDTLACITGGMASAYYKHIPQKIMDFVVDKLPVEYIEIMNKFDEHCVKDI
jgi:ADP-ribosylglycohydrolase